jgi:protein SCO1/2
VRLRSLTVAALILLAGCSTKRPLPSLGVVPDFTLTDQSGREFHSRQHLAGKVWVANFIFTNCVGPCPRMSGQMRQVRDATKDQNVRLVSFTVDPARDTPNVLAAYGKQYDADPERWFFLTGTQPQLHHLFRDVFMLGNVDGSLEHSTRFVLVDRESRIRGFYHSSDPEDMRKLIRDLGQL